MDRAKIKSNVEIQKEPTFQLQIQNQQNFQSDLKISDFVYKQFDFKLFDKSFDVSVICKFRLFLKYICANFY